MSYNKTAEKAKVFFVMDNGQIYAVPAEICKQYVLEEDEMKAVQQDITKEVASMEDSDVEGQYYNATTHYVDLGWTGYYETGVNVGSSRSFIILKGNP